MNEVKVTVLMPAYNAGQYIAEAIRSVLAQDFDSFELLIINDGSTDNTGEIIKGFDDARIKLTEQENNGIIAALNRGLLEAKGKYIARFDADDICMPQRLRIQSAFLDDNPGYIVCGSDAEYITEDGEHLFDFHCAGYEHADIMKNMYVHCPVIHSAAMYRKEAITEAGGYPLYAYSFEDHLLWVQLKEKGFFTNIPRQLVKIRFSASSFTIDEKWRGKRFRKLKSRILHNGTASEAEGKELLSIINEQNNTRFKEASYYALCGKKFLIENNKPVKSRGFFRKAIGSRPLRADNYILYVLSFFPSGFIRFLHKGSKRQIS